MAINHLLSSLARRSRHSPPISSRFHQLRSASTIAVSDAVPTDVLGPPPPTLMPYDRAAEEVKRNIKRLESPDERFLRRASPFPKLHDYTSVLAKPETRVTTLPNGLRVATESNLASRTATVGVWIDAGSRYETEETNGTAHFLEHMIFKGTKNRTHQGLEEEIENLGAHLNACTSREQTIFYTNVMAKDVTKSIDILADILQNSRFDERRIEHERDVILRETKEIEDVPEEVIFDHLHATAFQYTPLGRTILGLEKNVKTITKAHLENYISTHYTTPRMVISAAGAVKHEDVVEQVKKLFTKLSSEPTTATQLVAKEPAVFTGSEVRIIDDDMPIAKFAVAFNGASWTDPDSIALMVMQTMLGSWDKSHGGGMHVGSELVQKIAINEVAESIMAFNTNYKDTGLFGVYVTAKPDHLGDLSFAIMQAISKLSYRVSEDDVTRACTQLKSNFMLSMDGPGAVAEDIGRQLLTYGRRMPLPELFARIDAVDASTVKRVANRFICDRDLAIVAMGPIQDLPDYNWFRRRTYLLRY
ncbi:hypothetical protein QJS04_geneDACA008028 [Acorus gramineus]|uniref:mitochondrial processing peptidase n=1 Tax=Acorus gramineus TaxID=55184 RepID=A0AAV9B7J9_ACOGR|nr:hypothetical protein QJS04_geneDACA008028 [Acorus gramineus]